MDAIKKIFKLSVTRAFVALILVLILGAIFNADGAFFRWTTHRDMLRYISVFAILGCGMTLVIITGGIDLSVGSVVGLTAVLFSLMSIHWGWNPVFAIAASLVVGMICGIVSGSLISKWKMQPFIATLAMMVFARGVAKWVSGGQKISTAVQQADSSYKYVDVPKIFDFISTKIFNQNIAVVTIIFLVCAFVSYIILSKLRWGRYIFAIGGNEEAARLSGVPVAMTKLLAYGLCGLFAAVAGICQAAQEQQGDPEAGSTYELTAIAIVVIGGSSLSGGRGGVGLTIVGAMTIGYLNKILSINAVSEAHRLMLTGIIIAAAVLFQKTKKT